jgi:Arc/MetJ family transcription regulator
MSQRRLTPVSFVFCLALVALAAMLASPSAVARTVRVYDVEIKGEAVGPAVQDAMRRVIVRATGRRESAGDPAFAALVSDAQRYVQSSRKLSSGMTLVTFDGSAVEQAISSAGRSVWDKERPFTFVVFQPALTPQQLEAVRGDLDRAAESRGLPINLAPVPLVDGTGAELPREAVLEGAQRLGGDAVLIARSDAAGPGQYQWTLQTQFGSESWTGPIEAGPNGAVDSLTRAQESTAGVAELEAVVQVAGVASLNDYAAVSRLLESIPGQKKVSVAETNGSTATFNVLVRGGADTVARLLGNSPHLAKGGSANGQLLYTYRP